MDRAAGNAQAKVGLPGGGRGRLFLVGFPSRASGYLLKRPIRIPQLEGPPPPPSADICHSTDICNVVSLVFNAVGTKSAL